MYIKLIIFLKFFFFSEIQRDDLGDQGQTLYDEGFRFYINLNCSFFKIEVIYSDKFVKKLSSINCEVGKIDMKACNREINCKKSSYGKG